MDNKVTKELFDKTFSGDFVTEVSMPDYEAEVRRLLHVSAKFSEPVWYADGGRMGINGEILYSILYSGSDGDLHEIEARESYDIAEAYKSDRLPDAVFCEVYPESLTSRVSAPRKLSIKCRARAFTKGFCEDSILEDLSYIENPASIERLTDEVEYLRILPPRTEELLIEESFPFNDPDARIISSRADVYCDSVEVGDGEVTVKGNALVSVLIEDEDGQISVKEERIPIREFIPADDVTPSDKCSCRFGVNKCQARLENGEMFTEVGITATLFPAGYSTAKYSKDLYSTDNESTVSKKIYTHTNEELGFCGNISESHKESVPSLDGAVILEVIPYGEARNITVEDGRIYLLGDVTLSVIYQKDGETASEDLKWQFKYEIPNRESIKFDSAPSLLYSSACVASPRVKLEGGMVSASCEIHLSGKLCSNSSFEAVGSATFGKEVKKDEGITVCFMGDSSLFESAKANHVTVASILSKNTDPEGDGFFIV